MEYVGFLFGFVFLFGFWIGALIKLTKVEGGLGLWVSNIVGCTFICFILSFLIMVNAGTGWAALGSFLLAAGLSATILFVWGLILFFIAVNKTSKKKIARVSYGDEEILDDLK